MVINNIGQAMAMDGRRISIKAQPPVSPQADTKPTEVLELNSIKEILKRTQANVQHLEDISDILGRKLLFNVNEEIGKVVVKIVDPSTNKVIKEIPSEDIQKLQAHLKEAIGLLVDEKI